MMLLRPRFLASAALRVHGTARHSPVRRLLLPSAPELLMSMRRVAGVASELAAAAGAWRSRVLRRAAQVGAMCEEVPRSLEHWRLGYAAPARPQGFGRVFYYDSRSRVSQWEHPLTGRVTAPLVGVEDLVAAQYVWPCAGSMWEIATTASGGICYVDAGSGDVTWVCRREVRAGRRRPLSTRRQWRVC